MLLRRYAEKYFEKASQSTPIDEQKENQSEPKEPEVNNPALIQQPDAQQVLPFKNINTCAYPGCNVNVDVYNIKDTNTGQLYCRQHGGFCKNCDEGHIVSDLMPANIEDDFGRKVRAQFCDYCYSSLFTECPNCNEIVKKEDRILPTERNKNYMKHGGCDECSTKCEGCDKIIEKDSSYRMDDDYYCEDCYSERFGFCEGCHTDYPRDDLTYVEGDGDYCSNCFSNKFTACEKCNETIEKDAVFNLQREDLCETCYDKFNTKAEELYSHLTSNFQDFTYTKKDRFLNQLYKILPISVRDLKTKYPSIAAGLNDLPSFAKGKELTDIVVQRYRQALAPEKFEVEYTSWGQDLQRSVKASEPQLVLNVLLSEQMHNNLSKTPALLDLFHKVNEVSDMSGHPFVQNQIGWARLELDEENKQILVDEIQSDHSNAGYKLKHDKSNAEINKIRNGLKNKYNLDDDGLNKMLSEYSLILKDFPNIATAAINKFARKNGFKKIFWHTYESGKKLKDNDPPKSLYDKTPKENFFMPSENKPFGLLGDFFEREARQVYQLYSFAKRYFDSR